MNEKQMLSKGESIAWGIVALVVTSFIIGLYAVMIVTPGNSQADQLNYGCTGACKTGMYE